MFIPDPRWEEPNLLIPGKKPTGPVTIDWSHPLARGLRHYWSVGAAFIPEALHGAQIDLSSGGLMLPSVNAQIGQCLETTNTTSQYRRASVIKPDPTDPMVIAFDFVSTQDEATTGVFSWGDSPTDSSPYILVNSVGTDQLQVMLNAGYRVTLNAPQGELSRIIISFDGVNTTTVYRNGESVGTYSSSTLGTRTAPYIYIGSGYNGSHRGFYGNVGIWEGRNFTAGDAISYSRDPYQILCPA